MFCGCCGAKWETTGCVCFRCTSWHFCHCGTKFCAEHQSALAEEHFKTCGVYTNVQMTIVGSDWTPVETPWGAYP